MAQDPATDHIPSQSQDLFTYSPIDNSYSVRILTLKAGSGDEPLVGYLTVENLDYNPDYEAISYVWGTEGRCSEILLDFKVLPLTRSIHDALKRMRHPTQSRRLWADQICINQDDIAERSQQVGLMNAIYKGAKHILVWLGPDEDGVAKDAVTHIHHLHGIFDDDLAHDAFKRAHSEELLLQSKEPWVPFSKLTRLPWFNRIWIVQEIGTAAPATLYWGEAELDWEVLSRVASVLNQRYHYLRTRFSIWTPNIGYLYRRFVEPEEDYDTEQNQGKFIFELHRARHLLSKDARDHVYAFLGHYTIHSGSTALQDIEADYSRSVEDIFYDIAARDLSGANTLLLLSACHSQPSAYRKRDAERISLPSWVPDWRIKPIHLLGSPMTPHCAAGDTKPKLLIDGVHRALHIQGRRLDTISRCSAMIPGKAFQFTNERNRRLPMEVLWQDICGYKRFTLDESYLNGDFAFYALVQTLTNASVGVDRSRPYASISKMEWLANGAAYLVRAEGGSDLIAPEIQELAQGGDAFKWSHEATLVSRYRKFAVTREGYYLIGPEEMEMGDAVVVLYGGKTPFVLRQGDNGWRLLGECYVHGMMEGEALSEDGVDEVFVLV